MYRMIIALAAGLSALFLILTCGDSPTDPFSPKYAGISLLLKSSTFQESDTAVTDTVGKTVRLDLCLYLTQHIDSTVITVSPSPTRNDTVLKCTKKDRSIDTAFYDLVFTTAGTRTVSAIAYVGKDLRQVTAKIHIIARPTPNRKPELTVTGPRTIHPGQACTLFVSVDDPDSGQVAIIDTLKCPQGSSFSDTVFTWLPTIADTGIDTVIFIARDNGFPVLTDTAIVPITVKPLKVNHPPTWSSDTIDLSGTVGWPVSLPLAGKCIDPDNDTLSFALLAGAPDGDTVLNDSYSLTPAHEGTFYPRVIARDPQPLSDTLVIKLTISAADTTPPQLRLMSPDKDTTTISASSCQIRIFASDESGILSLRCAMGADSFAVTRSADTVYSATVTGLVQDQFNRIILIAIDSSRSANRCTLSVYIKYDSTMLDAEGPVIIQKSGPASGSVITNPVIAITDSIIDPSGIDSVYWTLNGVRAGAMSVISGSTTNYTLRDTLTAYRLNRIAIHAIDRSSRRNRDSAIVELDYNLPPIINDTAVATDRNAAKTWTLNARSPDNDTLFWSRLTSPSSLSGTVTGALPSVTFTPANNWSGSDSFFVRVSDGYWNDTAKVKITVVDLPVAPSIVTQPQSLTKTAGQSAAFSVTINTDVNPAPAYQWKKNGTAISGANAASFSIGAVAIEDSGSYTVTIINSAGTVTSNPALLDVQYAPVIITQPQSQTLYLGQAATFTVSARGNPAPNYTWQKNGGVINGATGASYSFASPVISDSGKYTVAVTNSIGGVTSDTARYYAVIKCISASRSHSLFLKTDGRLFACGANNMGQLGDNTTTDRLKPVQVLSNVEGMAAGEGHSLFLKTDGTLWACGDNGIGQLGDSTIHGSTSTPMLVMSNVQKVAAGGYHSLMLKTDGTLWVCGDNGNGQLGDSTIHISASIPSQVMSSVLNVAAGMYHSLILSSDGTLWVCGANAAGQLGDSTTIDVRMPKKVMSGVQSMAAGATGFYSLMLKADGTLWACGDNYYGQLGDGTTNRVSIPKQIITSVQKMSAGGGHSLILKTDSTLWACGDNTFGQFGDSKTTSSSIPKQVMRNVQNAAPGESHSLIMKTDGTIWTCGNNSNGQLGDGTTSDRISPVEISF